MIDLLFVYGSLMDSQNEFGHYLQHNSVLVNEGSFTGRLYDAGEYPAGILDAGGYKVKGKIYRLIDVNKHLTVLDDYEGYGEDQLQPNLFIRQTITAATALATIKCWVYIYNWPVNKLTEITSGDYASYKSK